MAGSRAQQAAFDPDDLCSNPSGEPWLSEIVARRLSRRQALRTLAAGAVAGALAPHARALGAGPTSLGFAELKAGSEPVHRVAQGYRADVLLRWGDPIFPSTPEYHPQTQTAADQARQFGYNCDFIAFLPLPRGSTRSDHGLLCVNHEYTNAELMFPGVQRAEVHEKLSEEQVNLERMAHGHSVVEIRQVEGRWTAVREGRFNRRITLDTPMRFSGPAAGHQLLKLHGNGVDVLGTLNNCAGGVTPWGTVLIAEENFNYYFHGRPGRQPYAASYPRYGIGGTAHYAWWKYDPRYELARTPSAPYDFGWIVEYDPYDPQSIPVKRTALGRFKHEGATCTLAPDGRVVVYCGDDQKGEFLYRFVSRRAYQPGQAAANRDLLDDGVLYAARFTEDGLLHWLPLEFGHAPLTPAHGFHNQGDVVLDARGAATRLGATPLDRPEDVETSPRTGLVYLMLTNNDARREMSAVCPRAPNPYGHIVELTPPGDALPLDHAADVFRWNIFLRGGDPAEPSHQADYHPEVSADGWLTAPDNCAWDPQGRLWIATDGMEDAVGRCDGIFACDALGPGRALTRLFFRGPVGCEICGPQFTPDGNTLFCAVQHPGEGSTFDRPSTRWPDDDPADFPPRPSVVAITREGGGPIGG